LVLPQLIRLFVRGEQGFQSLAEGAVAAADGLKEGRLLSSGLLDGQGKQSGLTFLR
jgi:hypothetical protein